MTRSIILSALLVAATAATAATVAPPATRSGVATAPSAPNAPSPPIAADAAVQELGADLGQVLRESGWPAESWGVMVVSLDGGDTLFSHQPEGDLTPASNMKLFTTAAALHYLGPNYRYNTYVAGIGAIRDGVLDGDLVLYGTGDPTIAGRFYDPERPTWEVLADSLAALGIRRVTGDVIGDASYFEGAPTGSGWQTTYITHTYAAPASALSFNDNVATLRVRPSDSVGAPPLVQTLPGGVVEFRNDARTVASGRTRIEAARAGYDAPLVLTGQIARGTEGVWRAVPVPDPAHFAASAFAEVLQKRGIEVGGVVRSIHDPAASPITGRGVHAPTLETDRPPVQVLAIHRSPPLLEILKIINGRSHNVYAESVLRTVGRVAAGSGTVEGGQAAMDALLADHSPAAATVRMDDGSGLSIRNRASPRSFVELLAFMNASPFRDAYLETLPEAAVDRGLRRMQQTPAAQNLRAKTGTIDRVSALSGYVRAANGEMLAFSIIANDVPSTWKAKRIEDRIGARLAAFDRPVPARVAAGSPSTSPRPAPGGTDTATAPPPQAGEPEVAARTGEAEAAPSSDGAAEPTTADGNTYTVKAGDTLDAIARRNGVSLAELESANPGLNPRRLQVGQELTIPGGP